MLRGSQETNKSHPKRTRAKKMSKTFSPKKDSEKHFPWFWWRIYRNHKAASFLKQKQATKQTTPRDRGVTFKLSATASPQPFDLTGFGSRGVSPWGALKFLMDQQMKNLQKQQPSKKAGKMANGWQGGWHIGAEVTKKGFSPHCEKQRKNGDLFKKHRVFHKKKLWFRSESGDLNAHHFCSWILGWFNNIHRTITTTVGPYVKHVFLFSGLADLPSGQGSGQGSIEGRHRKTRDCKAFTKNPAKTNGSKHD